MVYVHVFGFHYLAFLLSYIEVIMMIIFSNVMDFFKKIQVTVGASFLSQTIALQDSTTVKFEIWDTAGQERYFCLTCIDM